MYPLKEFRYRLGILYPYIYILTILGDMVAQSLSDLVSPLIYIYISSRMVSATLLYPVPP